MYNLFVRVKIKDDDYIEEEAIRVLKVLVDKLECGKPLPQSRFAKRDTTSWPVVIDGEEAGYVSCWPDTEEH